MKRWRLPVSWPVALCQQLIVSESLFAVLLVGNALVQYS